MYDNHFSSLNQRNRDVRPDISVYRDSIRIPESLRERTKNDYSTLKAILQKHARFSQFCSDVHLRIMFFDDSGPDVIENGFAHTIRNVICLPLTRYTNLDADKRTILLLHEAFHVFQRMFPFEFNKMLFDEFNMEVYSFSDIHPEARFNPDLNRLLYKDAGIYNVMLLNSDATTLGDAKIHEIKLDEQKIQSQYKQLKAHFSRRIRLQEEHPYETFACILAQHMFDGHKACKCGMCSKLNRWLEQK